MDDYIFLTHNIFISKVPKHYFKHFRYKQLHAQSYIAIYFLVDLRLVEKKLVILKNV